MQTTEEAAIAAAVNLLVDEWRDRALWFLREDYYPQTDVERHRVLDYIDERADVRTFQRVSELRKCLSPKRSQD